MNFNEIPEMRLDGNKIQNIVELQQWCYNNISIVNKVIKASKHLYINEQDCSWLIIINLARENEELMKQLIRLKSNERIVIKEPTLPLPH